MFKKIWNKTGITAIAGLTAYIVTILVLFIPFRGEPAKNLVDWSSPIAIIAMVLFAISLILYGIGIFKHDMDFLQKKTILENRQKDIPLIRTEIDKAVVRYQELARTAGELPLEDYYDRYFKNNDTFRKEYVKLVQPNEQLKRKIAIFYSMRTKNFQNKNTWLIELVGKDLVMNEIKNEIDTLLSRIGDRQLRKDIEYMYQCLEREASLASMSWVLKLSDIQFNSPEYYNKLYGIPTTAVDWIKNLAHNSINKKLTELEVGSDL